MILIEHITRNPTNFKEVELMDSISKLVDNGILINKKTKEDLDSLFVNEGTSTDNNTLPDIIPVNTETPNCRVTEASTKSDSDRFNDLKSKVNNNTANFSAFKSFVLDELHKIKAKYIIWASRIYMGAVLLKN